MAIPSNWRVVTCMAIIGICTSLPSYSETPPPLKPGLWEVKGQTHFDGQNNKTLNERISELPAEHRAWVESVAKNKGLPMDGVHTSRVCLSNALLGTQRWHTAPECSSTYSDRSSSLWRWHTTCPRAETDGEAAFQDPEHYTMYTVTTVNTERGTQQVMRRTAAYVWVGEDCGTTR